MEFKILNKIHDKYTFPDPSQVTLGGSIGARMDTFIYSACDLAKKMDIPVCDCYSKWKELSKTEDTTMLLANRINHPTKEMHELFAQSLFEMLFPDQATSVTDNESTMYKG